VSAVAGPPPPRTELPSRAVLPTRLLTPHERSLLAPLVGELLRHYGLPAPDDAALARLLAEQPPGPR
jgi:hypothetical protein